MGGRSNVINAAKKLASFDTHAELLKAHPVNATNTANRFVKTYKNHAFDEGRLQSLASPGLCFAAGRISAGLEQMPMDDEALVISDNADIYGTVRDL
jgi:hypothetical protein